MNDSNIVDYLQKQMKYYHDEISKINGSIKQMERDIEDDLMTIRIYKVVYTSLFKTACAYEDFDKEEFESCL